MYRFKYSSNKLTKSKETWKRFMGLCQAKNEEDEAELEVNQAMSVMKNKNKTSQSSCFYCLLIKDVGVS